MSTAKGKKKTKKRATKKKSNAIISIDTHDFSFWEAAKVLTLGGAFIGTSVLVTQGVYNKVSNYVNGLLEDDEPKRRDNVINLRNNKAG